MSETTRREVMLGAVGAATIPAPESEHPYADLMMGFYSLGRNCEFGQAQRNCGAEPLDLLRWAGITAPVLIKVLLAKFEGVSDSSLIKVYYVGKSPRASNTEYGFEWHAQGEDAPEEARREREAKRLEFLVRKFIEDIKGGSRISVLMDPVKNVTRAVAEEVVIALQAYGSPQLLYVTSGSPLGVEREGECLMHGTMPAFADTRHVATATDAAPWLELCRKARLV